MQLDDQLSFDLRSETREIFSPDGLLARALPGFEPRPGQAEMAQAIASILHNDDPWNQTPVLGQKLAVEAETGIGKTLAYLIPAVLSGQKIVVSTGTINLQEQILNKEIPFIKKHIDPTLEALCIKGRQNYLCIYRYRQLTASPQIRLFRNLPMEDLEQWADETLYGDRSELDWLPDHSPLWHEISASTNQCLGGNCPDFSRCFVTRIRKEAGSARILIVNHHLFFSDLALRRFGFGEVLPRYESVIFDEAHHIENVATRYFGISLSHYQIMDLVQDIERQAGESIGDREQEKALGISRSLQEQTHRFATIFPLEKGRFPLTEFIDNNFDIWQREVDILGSRLDTLADQLEIVGLRFESWNGFTKRVMEIRSALKQFTLKPDDSYVYWYERKPKTVALTASPIDIARDLNQSFYNEVKSVIFTSATLTTGGNFNYFFGRLGLDDQTRTLTLPTPFDYKNRSRLYLPQDIPAPNDRGFLQAAQQEITNLLMASEGRALVLFTSIKVMEYMYQSLSNQLPFPIFMQGEASKQKLLESFREETHSVLLAVSSFWEGVDVQGETLSMVIIDKLPFEVPSDPVINARIEKMRKEGKNPFFDFQVPRAILTLRQGLGRLMRSSTDRGILAVLDGRLTSKSYGKIFLNSIPAAPVIRDIEDVHEFFRQG